MSSNTDINETYRVVVRRGAVGPKPFVWEIRHKLSEFVVRSSEQQFTSMEEAHRSGRAALEQLSRTSTAR
jgi:hypothetical protein